MTQKLPNITVTTWGDYKKAAMRTCTNSSRNSIYMALGLMSEAGEVTGKIAKHVRDDNGKLSDGRKEQIAAELGDVLWMIAGIFSLPSVDCWLGRTPNILAKDDALKQGAHSLYSRRSLTALAAMLQHKCTVVGRAVLDYNVGRHWWDFESIIKIIATMAVMLDTSLLEICQNNINKLTDRYNRNVIAGSGDNR